MLALVYNSFPLFSWPSPHDSQFSLLCSISFNSSLPPLASLGSLSRKVSPSIWANWWPHCTMGRITMKSIHSFVRIDHLFTCFTLFASLARSAALICLLARSLTHSRAHWTEVFVYGLNASISYILNPLCTQSQMAVHLSPRKTSRSAE